MGTKPILVKTVRHPETNPFAIALTQEEIQGLSSTDGTIKTYCWGLMLYLDGGYSQIVIPSVFQIAPKFLVYPGIDIEAEESAEEIEVPDNSEENEALELDIPDPEATEETGETDG